MKPKLGTSIQSPFMLVYGQHVHASFVRPDFLLFAIVVAVAKLLEFQL